MPKKSGKQTIEKELEKLGPDMYEYAKQLLEFLKEIVDQEGGSLPSPESNPEFYQAIDTFLEFAKDNLLDITQKDLAEYLGVPYDALRRNRSMFHRRQKKSQEQSETQQGYDAVVDVAQPAPQPPSPPETTSSFTTKTEAKLDKQVSDAIAKKMEHVVKEEVDIIFRIGKTFVDKYKHVCYKMGHEDLVECLHNAMTFFSEAKDEYEYLKQRIDQYKNTIRYLLLLSKPEMSRIIVIEKAKKMIEYASMLPPRKRDEVIDRVIKLVESVIA